MSINMVSENISAPASITKSHEIYVRQHVDSSNFVISVFLDFKRAFDTVDHKKIYGQNLILMKLEEFYMNV